MSTKETLPMRYRSRGLYIIDGDAVGEGSIAMAQSQQHVAHIITALNQLDSLRTRLDAAEKELERVKAEKTKAVYYGKCKDETATVFMNQVKKLQEANAELVKDKERLDILGKLNGTLLLCFGSGVGIPTFAELSETGKDPIIMPTVRQAIDAAIAKGTQ